MKKENVLPADRSSLAYKAKRLFKRNWSGWLLMLPGLLLFLFFVWAPLAQNVLLSFGETKGFEAVCGGESVPGNLALPRKQEIYACVNRYRGLRL